MSEIPSSTWFTVSPDWGWLVVLYFFFGGLAGGCYLLAALADLLGRPEDRPLARAGYYVVLPCLAISGILLIFDLTRPARFWHLFLQNHTFEPMFKHWAPMSLGSWALPLFSLFALLSFLGALAEAKRIDWAGARHFRPPGLLGGAIAIIGALLGLYVAGGYTGVMLAVTNRPIWADTPLLGMLLVVSGTSISVALMILLALRNRWSTPGVLALWRMNVWLRALELLVLVAVVVSLGAVARAWLNLWGVLLLVGAVGVGMLLPLLLARRGDWLGERTPLVAAALVLLGGFVLRTVIVFSPDGAHL